MNETSRIPFEVGDLVRYAPEWRSPGEKKYIHIVREINPETGHCLIKTLNSKLLLGSTEWVTIAMIERIHPEEELMWRICLEEVKQA